MLFTKIIFFLIPKIIKECNCSVQSMKRMEELIHLNKKIHFESKVCNVLIFAVSSWFLLRVTACADMR